MLADHSSLVVTQRYIDRDREAWRTNVDLVCPNGLADYFFAKYFAFKILSVKLMVAGAKKNGDFPG